LGREPDGLGWRALVSAALRRRKVLVMRWLIASIYMLTALVGLYWSVSLTLTGLYGVPFSWAYAALFVGALLLAAGSVLTGAATRGWTLWLPVTGSGIVAGYFVWATLLLMRDYYKEGLEDFSTLIMACATLALVLGSLALSVYNGLQTPK
jgi:hypothetical protein